MKRSCFFLLYLFFPACVTVGRPFPVPSIPAITVGQTTRTELSAVFGSPYRTGVDDGDETWTYLHYKLRLMGEQQTRDLYVRFNRDGTVKSYSFNSSLDADRDLLRRVKSIVP